MIGSSEQPQLSFEAILTESKTSVKEASTKANYTKTLFMINYVTVAQEQSVDHWNCDLCAIHFYNNIVTTCTQTWGGGGGGHTQGLKKEQFLISNETVMKKGQFRN